MMPAEPEVEDDQDEDTGKYTFAELSERAKDNARDAIRYDDVDNSHEWWDCVYEQAIGVAALIGITIGTKTRRTTKNCLHYPALYFSGFASQGDGACFEGHYECKPDAVKAVREEWTDEGLIKIAEELTALQVKIKFDLGETLSAEITTGSSNYCHSHTMEFNVYLVSNIDSEISNNAEEELGTLMRRFADWIYNQLEQEHDYLTSDTHLDERLADLTFDADGDII